MRRTLGTLMVMVSAHTVSLGAQDTAGAGGAVQESGARFISGQLGLGVISVPRYLGSDERLVIPVPIIDVRVAQRVYLGGSATGVAFGTGLYLKEGPGFAWSVDLTMTPNRPENRADALAGMGDRGFAGYGGTTLFFRRGFFQMMASVGVGVQQEMGVTGTLGLSLGQPIGRRWFSRLDAVTTVASCSAMAWDFAVTEAQAARRGELLAQGAPGLEPGDDVPYSPKCGLRDVRLGGTVVHGIRHNLSAVLSGTGVRLLGGAADSPLTRTKTTWEATLGLAWRF